jgi:hypothetical protein
MRTASGIHSYQVFIPSSFHAFPFRTRLESRCLTSEMLALTRDDIPRVLPPAFDREVNELRSKLLTFRLANLTKPKGPSATSSSNQIFSHVSRRYLYH